MLGPDMRPAMFRHQDGVSGTHVELHKDVYHLAKTATTDLRNLTNYLTLERKLKDLGNSAQDEGLSGQELEQHQEAAVRRYNDVCVKSGMEIVAIKVDSITPLPPPPPEN